MGNKNQRIRFNTTTAQRIDVKKNQEGWALTMQITSKGKAF
jgi:hypothetical protein